MILIRNHVFLVFLGNNFYKYVITSKHDTGNGAVF